MTRRLLIATVFCWLGLVAGPPVWAQDEIRYYDRTKKAETTTTGTIQEESPSRVVYKPATGAGVREIAAADMVDVFYQVRPALKPDYRSALNKERNADKAKKESDRKKDLDDAIRGYRELLPKLGEAKAVQRHLQFKIAQLTVRQADEDSSLSATATEALEKFRKDHPGGWQTIHCAKLLARLQLQKEDFEGALKTYEGLAKAENISKEIQQECELLAAQTLTRAKKYPQAQQRLQEALRSLAPDDPQAARVQVYLAECQACTGQLPAAVKQLEAIIAKTTDPSLKALAYNTLGYCYRTNKQLKDALWAYLWVDVVYYQDKQEHAKAIAQLAELFAELSDDTRAKQYREKMQRGK